MAEATRTRRHLNIIAKPKSFTADRDVNLTSPLPNHNCEIDKAGDAGLWTPEPELCDFEQYTTWGKKHYGEDWYEQRTKMLEERNFLKVLPYDSVYVNRQKALREMECERERGKLLMKGKTWQELWDWARMHYGEVWYQQRQALDRDSQQAREIQDMDERNKQSLKAAKRRVILDEMELQRDKGMLAEGKTWQEIMAWPVEPSDVLPSAEAGGDAVSWLSSISRDSDRTGYTYPPDFRRQAMDGPQMASGQKGRGQGNWGHVEWMTIRNGLSKAWYEEKRMAMTVAIRSSREDEECERRNREELVAISSPFGYMPENAFKREERARRMRHLDLRLKGWTQEQIDDMDQKEAAVAWEKFNAAGSIFNQAQTQERIDARVRIWDAQGTSLKERLEHANIFGWRDSIFNRPPTQEEIDETHRAWDFWKVSSERQIELNSKWFGFHKAKPASTNGVAENRVVSQPRASPVPQVKDTSRKTRRGRITKNAAQSQAPMPHGESKQLKQSSEGPSNSTAQVPRKINKRQPKAYKEIASHAIQDIGDQVIQSRPYNTKQKVYKQERESRRLAGLSPEYSMLSK